MIFVYWEFIQNDWCIISDVHVHIIIEHSSMMCPFSKETIMYY